MADRGPTITRKSCLALFTASCSCSSCTRTAELSCHMADGLSHTWRACASTGTEGLMGTRHCQKMSQQVATINGCFQEV